MGVAPKIFELYISTCILAGAMKLLIQALQQYIILSKKLMELQLALKTRHKTIFESLIRPPVHLKGQSSMHK